MSSPAPPVSEFPGAPDELTSAADLALTQNSAFRVETPRGRETLGAALLDQCNKARLALAKHTQVSIPFQTTVRWCNTEEEFLRSTGQRPESIVAAASPRRAMIWINGPAWQRSGPTESLPILIHEYAHVIVGKLSPVPLPRWADEGLAMHLAGQWTLTDSFSATRAQLFGGLPRLAELESGFPASSEGLQRAYLISYLAIEHLARDMGAKPGDVDVILDRLRDPQKGRDFALSLRQPEVRAQIQAQALAALGNTARKWIIYLTSGTTLWLLVTALFIYAYIRKKRRAAVATVRERHEEAWAESLTQQDIEEIYGAPQDTVEEPDEDDGREPWE